MLPPSQTISTIISLLRHHPSPKSRWAHISHLLINTPLNPIHFSLITLSLKNSPFLALSLFNLSIKKTLVSHSLVSYSGIVCVLSKERVLKSQTLGLIRKALVAFPNDTFEFFEMVTKSYRKCGSGPNVYDLLVEGVLRTRKNDVCVEIVKLLVFRGFLTVKTRNLVVKAVCERDGSLSGYNLFREMFFYSDFRGNLKKVDICGNVGMCENDSCDFMENVKNVDMCANVCKNEEIDVKEHSLISEQSTGHSGVNGCVSDNVGNISPNVCTNVPTCQNKQNENDLKDLGSDFRGNLKNVDICANVGISRDEWIDVTFENTIDSCVSSIDVDTDENVDTNMCTTPSRCQNEQNLILEDFTLERKQSGADSVVSGIVANIGQNVCRTMPMSPNKENDMKDLSLGCTKSGADSYVSSSNGNISQNVCTTMSTTLATCQNELNENDTNNLSVRRRQSVVSSHVDKVRPNVSTYNVILLAFYRDGMISNLEGVWAEMMKRGTLPNTYSYSVLMRAYCEDERMVEAERVWEEMVKKGLKRDEVAYEIMIGGYCSIGEVARAEEFFREMEMSGIKGSCASFEHLIKGYCEISDLGSALLLCKDMCRRGFRPEGPVVDVVVQGFCRENRVYEGLEFLRVAMKKYEVVPRWKSYEVLMKGLCDEGMMEEALKLQAEMVGKGFEPNSDIYKVFIGGFMKQGNDEMARRMKKEMVDTQMTN